MSDTVAIAGITAAAGLGGAVIAAIAAEYRQKNALAHDREMRDLSEIRNRLDDVMDQGEKALAAMDKANDALNEELLAPCEEHLQTARENLIKVQARIRRIRLLYGDDYDDDGDLVIPLQTYLENLEAVHDLLQSECEQSGERDEEEFNRVVGAAGVSQRQVIVVASRLVGARFQQ
ncbi:MAG: hypothetical protein WAQ33_07180 [Gaiellaceae bacterium]